MFLIELALLILISIEMYKVRKYFLSKDFYKISDKQMRSAKQYKVNSSYPEDGQYIRAQDDTVQTLKDLIKRMNVRDAGKGEFTTIKEI